MPEGRLQRTREAYRPDDVTREGSIVTMFDPYQRKTVTVTLPVDGRVRAVPQRTGDEAV